MFGRVHFTDVAVLLYYSYSLRAVAENVEDYLQQIIQILYGTRVGYARRSLPEQEDDCYSDESPGQLASEPLETLFRDSFLDGVSKLFLLLPSTLPIARG